jgi:DNA-binding response OmpR family regulator
MTDRPARILIVDDEEQHLSLIQEILVNERCILVKARDGLEALDKFEKFQPDLVLLDLLMPRLDGFEVCAQLKRSASGRGVPVIILTSLAEDEARIEAHRRGADGLLTKPFLCETLCDRVHAALPALLRR